jgi:tetratricopeptide (TPR) repeat protein
MVSVAPRKKRKHPQIEVSRPGPKLLAFAKDKSVYFAVAALLVIAFACYANALANGFVFDDHGHVLSDQSFRSLSNVPSLLVSSYRPLRDVTYAIDFAIWGERPLGFHLTNVLIHVANTLLVFALLMRITRKTLVASLAALIFAIHPIQPDAVTYISGRRDVLFSLFYLASFHSYLTYRRDLSAGQEPRHNRSRAWFYFGLMLVCWALSLLSKEMAASLPLFIFVWSFCDVWDRENGSWGRQFLAALKKAFGRDKWLYLVLLLAVPAYVWYQVFVKGGSARAGISGFDYWGGSFYTNLLTSIKVHAWYLKQLVIPTPIVQYSGAFDIATSPLDWRVMLSIVVVGATIVAGFVLLNRDKLMAFAVLSFFAMLLPVSQIIPHQELLADHYLYLPMMSFGLFVASLAQKFSVGNRTIKRLTYGVAAALLIVFAIMTVTRNTVYKDDFTLWKTNYKEVPTSIRALSSLAGQYAISYPAKGAELYKQCIAVDPSYAPAYVSIALLYQTRDKAREAEELIQQGLALPDSRVISPGYEDPNRFRSELTTALAISKGFQGLQKEAEALMLKAIDLFPANEQPYAPLASYYHTADPDKEIALLKRQVAGFPTDYYALRSLSFRLIEDKRYDDALPYLERMRAMVPNDFYANYQLGQIYRSKKDCEKAGGFLTTAQQGASSPDDSKAIQDALTRFRQECGGS